MNVIIVKISWGYLDKKQREQQRRLIRASLGFRPGHEKLMSSESTGGIEAYAQGRAWAKVVRVHVEVWRRMGQGSVCSEGATYLKSRSTSIKKPRRAAPSTPMLYLFQGIHYR